MQYLLITLVMALFLSSSIGYAKDFTKEECPVVGNTNSMIYHLPSQKFYDRMLIRNRGKDNRRCFPSEKDAQKEGYRRSRI